MRKSDTQYFKISPAWTQSSFPVRYYFSPIDFSFSNYGVQGRVCTVYSTSTARMEG